MTEDLSATGISSNNGLSSLDSVDITSSRAPSVSSVTSRSSSGSVRSRLPRYVGNGCSPVASRRPSSGSIKCFNSVMMMENKCAHRSQTMHRLNCDHPVDGHLLPYHVRIQHASHNCYYVSSNEIGVVSRLYGRGPGSAPASYASRRTTPTPSSEPGTPLDVESLANGIKRIPSSLKDEKCCSNTSTPSVTKRNNLFSRQASLPSRRSPSSVRCTPPASSSGRTLYKLPSKLDEYKPLCEVQRNLRKGEVIEGVLRINPRNFDDAYISAPIFIGRGGGGHVRWRNA